MWRSVLSHKKILRPLSSMALISKQSQTPYPIILTLPHYANCGPRGLIQRGNTSYMEYNLYIPPYKYYHPRSRYAIHGRLFLPTHTSLRFRHNDKISTTYYPTSKKPLLQGAQKNVDDIGVIIAGELRKARRTPGRKKRGPVAF